MIQPFIHLISILDAKLRKFEQITTICMIFLVVLLVLSQVISRNIFYFTFEHFDSVSRLLAFDVALLGAIFATRKNKHLNMDTFNSLIKGRAHVYLRVIVLFWSLIMTILLLALSIGLVLSAYEYGDTYLGIYSLWIIQLILPYVFFSMFISNLHLLACEISRLRK
jgi:TRAP-type C4-dicarboxylate transport system permease small subunit